MDFNATQDDFASSQSLPVGLDLEPNPNGHLPAEHQVFHASQACNECKRRKGKCDRVAPECGSCSRSHRHCLYGSISKTPLTRKHLTDVEHRLTAANLEIQNLRQALRQYKEGRLDSQAEPSVLMEVNSPEKSFEVTPASKVAEDHTPNMGVPFTETETESDPLLQQAGPSQMPLEDLPISGYDFDWNEHSISTTAELKTSIRLPEDDEFIDGMASLSVYEKDVGYLGVASGAALLRMLHPSKGVQKTSLETAQKGTRSSSASLYPQPDPHIHIVDAMIDGYFRSYHLSYPIVHEPLFRAQYSGVIQCPKDTSWPALIYIIAALGAFSTASNHNLADVNFFHAAKSHLSIDDLQSGNTTLVQTLALMANYLQKRNKPNSGYNYLGLALRMAMGLGLHKEFPGWDIKPLQMEIRRRVWWTLFVFDVGAAITFSRPLSWPSHDVKLPLNINDRDLTATTTAYPNECTYPTTYSAVRTQVAFHLATNSIYTRVTSVPFPSPKEVLDLDEKKIVPWLQSLPSWYHETAIVPPQYALGHAIMMWRYRNLRLIMYRPFVIRYSLKSRANSNPFIMPADEQEAYKRCLSEASTSINMIESFWLAHPQLHTELCAWYALYFLFQASLVPIICLRNDPLALASNDWRLDIRSAMRVIDSMSEINPSSVKCMNTINNLCEEYLINTPTAAGPFDPTDDSPQTQISNAYPMMWPNLPGLEANVFMQDDTWLKFLEEAPIDGSGVLEYTDGNEQWSI